MVWDKDNNGIYKIHGINKVEIYYDDIMIFYDVVSNNKYILPKVLREDWLLLVNVNP